jgi:hypothetical protein
MALARWRYLYREKVSNTQGVVNMRHSRLSRGSRSAEKNRDKYQL